MSPSLLSRLGSHRNTVVPENSCFRVEDLLKPAVCRWRRRSGTKAKPAPSPRWVGLPCTYRFRARAVVSAASRTVNEKPTQRELDAPCARGSSAPEENVRVRKIETLTSWKYKQSNFTGQTSRWVGSSSPPRRPQPFWRLGGDTRFPTPPPPRWSQSTKIGKRVPIGDRLTIRSLCEKGKLRFSTL